MSNKNIYEVLAEFKTATTKQARIAVLRSNDTPTLRNVLIGTFHPRVQFTVKKLPKYEIVEIPAGLSYSNMPEALSRVYLFQKDNPKAPKSLTEERKTQILQQMLEGLEPPEAEVFCGMLMKNLKVPYLTVSLVNEAFPGLIPEK